MENIFKHDAFKLGYEAARSLSEKEDKQLNDLAEEETHEHEDSVDADGTCLVCGKTNLL